MKKHQLSFVSLVLIFFFSFSASAQTNAVEKKSEVKVQKAAKGTYQFIVDNIKSQVVFSDEILYEVEKNRDEKEIKYLQLGSQAKVKILPRSVINSADFIPIKEEIIYLD